jgi:CRP-like cAMP-binding protein
VAVVGKEGVASISAILGRNWLPFRVVTQIPGRALRVPTDLVSTGVKECGELHDRLMDYTHQMIAQIAQSAVCNRFHNARQRLARWLLMTADRVESRQLPLTHEFISFMVGGPRSAVTEAASELRASGAIDYRRGLIVIRSATILREQSCECYGMLAPSAPPAGFA